MYTVQVPEFIKSGFLLSRMKKIVTISRYIRDKIIAFAPKSASRISILYYGIDLHKFQPAAIRRGVQRRRFNLSPDIPIIGTVGDLWKNQIEFLDALFLIKKEMPDARFALVANENKLKLAEAAFKDRAAALGLIDSILWIGRLSKDDMLSFYADIDIAVSTHRNEGFGIWVLEAMAMGTPVVSINEGGIRDSLENCPAGVLVDGGAQEMTQEIIRILKDKAVCRRMSEAGPRWVQERFGLDRMVEDYLRFFKSLL
jgi:glycosyltransferase involved in cell wall biosynthesis